MKERPIIMSAPMVRAILEGRKSQTRRVVKPQPRGMSDFWPKGSHTEWQDILGKIDYYVKCGYCPYGIPGDRLWVKETFWHDIREPNECVIYAESPGRHKYRTRGIVEPCEAGLTEAYLQRHEFWKKCPSIFMPRWASRITLEITGVRVERVQEISEEDVWSEGAITHVANHTWKKVYRDEQERTEQARVLYSKLWDSINGKTHPWSSNPWVWVIEFRKL